MKKTQTAIFEETINSILKLREGEGTLFIDGSMMQKIEGSLFLNNRPWSLVDDLPELVSRICIEYFLHPVFYDLLEA